MITYFAAPERYSDVEVDEQMHSVASHQLIKSLMQVVQGFFVVLNDKRQIVAINHSFLSHLGIDKCDDVFGLRLGETVDCIHANVMEGKCGTSKFCGSCGAAISMVTALRKHKTSEKICTIRTKTRGKQENLYFKVKSIPVDIEEKQYILIFLDDITYNQKMAELENLFFHDVYNKVSGIINGCEILKYQYSDNSEIVNIIYNLTNQLVSEIEFQKRLVAGDMYNIEMERDYIKLKEIYTSLKHVFMNHDVSRDKNLIFPSDIEQLTFFSDSSIIIRVLTNMIKNAFEASDFGEQVVVDHEIKDEVITFRVWNKKKIADNIVDLIFKRNVTTKKENGHGFGTFSMKVLGEDMLGGKVYFETSEETGTTFYFEINI